MEPTARDRYKKKYALGLQSEEEVKQAYRDDGSEVKDSTTEENVLYDIDCYVDGIPVSIKTDHMCRKTGNLCFEIAVRVSGTWRKSWFYTSKAAYYLIRVGDLVYVIKTSRLKKWVKENGFDRITNLTRTVLDEQQHHVHSNARLGLIKLSKLLQSGVAYEGIEI